MLVGGGSKIGSEIVTGRRAGMGVLRFSKCSMLKPAQKMAKKRGLVPNRWKRGVGVI
jgi:hypothetical protein